MRSVVGGTHHVACHALRKCARQSSVHSMYPLKLCCLARVSLADTAWSCMECFLLRAGGTLAADPGSGPLLSGMHPVCTNLRGGQKPQNNQLLQGVVMI
jgi:hypothetical protein